jgi:hypothetical protein
LPIVVGPWLGESGYELLYWIPFVRRIVETYNVPRDSLFVVSKGGTAAWYGDLATHYTDIFSLMPLDEMNAAFAEDSRPQGQWSTIKQQERERTAAVAQEIVRRVAALHGFDEVTQFDPDVLTAVFRPYWSERESIAYVEQYSSYTAIQPPPRPDGLPPEYVAVRFYSNMFVPDTDENRRFVSDTIDEIQRDFPVVLLDQPVSFGGHRDLSDRTKPALRVFGDSMELATNYAVQTAAIGHARAFVGTFGSLSYLPVLCRVPSIAVHAEPGRRLLRKHRMTRRHFAVVENLSRHLGGTFDVCETRRSPSHVAKRLRKRVQALDGMS